MRLDPDRVTATPVVDVDDTNFAHAVLEDLQTRLSQRASDDQVIVCDEHVRGAMRRVALVDPYWHATTGFVYEVAFDVAGSPPLMVRTKAGWPVSALTCTQRRVPSAQTLDQIEFERRWMMRVRLRDDLEGRAVPLLPCWPGFAINTLLYAALLWLLLFAPFALRRAIRRRRNRCEHCGYPRGASTVCSECGATLRNITSR
jgi:hypothetical protein